MTPRASLVATAVCAVVVVAACRPRSAAETDAGVDAPILVAPDGVFVVQSTTLTTGPAISGSLAAAKHAVMRAEAGGSVLDVRAEIGDEKKRGALLARIEAQPQRDAYVSARSGVTAAEQDALVAERQRQRTARLVAAGALAQRDLEDAESAAVSARARLDAARSQLAGASKQLDAATVTAPFDGVVSKRSVSAGDIVAPGAELFEMIDPSTMRVTASVSSDQVGDVQVGRPVTFRVRGYPDDAFEGVIERVAPAADAATRQIQVLVAIPNPGNRLIAGLFAEGRVVTATRQALVVPTSAVDATGVAPRVLRVQEDGVVEQVEVGLGVRDDRSETIEITSGLAAGDVVLVGGARTVPAGARVAVQQRSDGAPARATGR